MKRIIILPFAKLSDAQLKANLNIYDEWRKNQPTLLDYNNFIDNLDIFYKIQWNAIKTTLDIMNFNGCVYASGSLTMPDNIKRAYDTINGQEGIPPGLDLFISQRTDYNYKQIADIARLTFVPQIITKDNEQITINGEYETRIVPTLDENNKMTPPREFIRISEKDHYPCVKLYSGYQGK